MHNSQIGVVEPNKEQKGIRVKYDTTKLKNENILKTFNIALRNRYQVA